MLWRLRGSSVKSHSQCSKASKKGNQVLGQLCRNIISKVKLTLMKLYKTYVRPTYTLSVKFKHGTLGMQMIFLNVGKRLKKNYKQIPTENASGQAEERRSN